jgi:hypothetical protein
MNTLLRFVLALALGVWLAMPSLGSEGGENAGGTGVWILPRATFMASGEVVEPAGEALDRAAQDLLLGGPHLPDPGPGAIEQVVGTQAEELTRGVAGDGQLGDRPVLERSAIGRRPQVLVGIVLGGCKQLAVLIELSGLDVDHAEGHHHPGLLRFRRLIAPARRAGGAQLNAVADGPGGLGQQDLRRGALLSADDAVIERLLDEDRPALDREDLQPAGIALRRRTLAA